MIQKILSWFRSLHITLYGWAVLLLSVFGLLECCSWTNKWMNLLKWCGSCKPINWNGENMFSLNWNGEHYFSPFQLIGMFIMFLSTHWQVSCARSIQPSVWFRWLCQQHLCIFTYIYWYIVFTGQSSAQADKLRSANTRALGAFTNSTTTSGSTHMKLANKLIGT